MCFLGALDRRQSLGLAEKHLDHVVVLALTLSAHGAFKTFRHEALGLGLGLDWPLLDDFFSELSALRLGLNLRAAGPFGPPSAVLFFFFAASALAKNATLVQPVFLREVQRAA